MIFQPCIALSGSAIVHVVVQIRDDPADDRQLSEIVGDTREVFFAALTLRKGFPWVMLSDCQGSAVRRPRIRIRTRDVSGECQGWNGAGENCVQRRIGLIVVFVICDPKRRTGIEREIVRL